MVNHTQQASRGSKVGNTAWYIYVDEKRTIRPLFGLISVYPLLEDSAAADDDDDDDAAADNDVL
jgi:hypothetical protein